jgi:hypothetical protein
VDLNDDNTNDAIVLLSEKFDKNETFYEITALISQEDKIFQTNSIVLGNKIAVKTLKVYPSNFPPYSSRCEIFVEISAFDENTSSTLPSSKAFKCFTLYKNKLIPCEEAPEIPIVKKPAIYLYPESTEKIEVILKQKGNLIKTIPEYKNGWLVTATPEGKIDGKYDYLFYETTLDVDPPLSDKGWSVSYKDLNKWFDTKLPELGLNKKEIEDFKAYWLNHLPFSPYYEIRIFDEKFLKENLSFSISPKPDTLIRVILHFRGTVSSSNLREPVLKTPERKGFTVVEWGGIVESPLLVKVNDKYIDLKTNPLIIKRGDRVKVINRIEATFVDGRMEILFEPETEFEIKEDNFEKFVLFLKKGKAKLKVKNSEDYAEEKFKNCPDFDKESCVPLAKDTRIFVEFPLDKILKIESGEIEIIQ